ncbi:ketoreductase domain-containing protein [Aspergillus mulundensis]|uniref:Ketoreductase domain-containing protein n=1 Tax=Aspergillus mulundensis TaxID=1810919 RepID=A0A3D8R4V1_9EURO|nr:hypothetical protein DSM5745_08852 [Aspergillus mulundensis]RDW69092.1 hypothetical protein DSM5745_08852 [Aspergillus mulundensis]
MNMMLLLHIGLDRWTAVSAQQRELRSLGRVSEPQLSEDRKVAKTVWGHHPAHGGVANAALVLEPAVFANLSAASIAKQMMPKIHSTIDLDEAFKKDPLDFFICFGSLGTTFGKPGHAIYHAGNAFMLSLVANCKRRGLTGSILDFRMLVDADFHHVILQGIATGDRTLLATRPLWVLMCTKKRTDLEANVVGTAALSRMVRRVSEAQQGGDAPSAGSQQSRLDNAMTVDEAISPVTELLSQKVNLMIRVSLDAIHPDEPLSRRGIDSINAIEIRE